MLEHPVDREQAILERGAHARLTVGAADEIGAVLDTHPFEQLQAALRTHVILLELAVAGVVNIFLFEETARQIVIRHVGAARNAQVVLVAGGVVAVNDLVPVGIAEVFILSVGIHAPFLERRIGIAPRQLGGPRRVVGENVVDRGGLLLEITDIGLHVGVEPSQAVGLGLGFDRPVQDRERTVVIDMHLAFHGIFRGHEHHAEGTAGSVHRRGRGVF